GAQCFGQLRELDDFDPSGLVRFHTLEEAEAKREELIRFIWKNGLPTEVLPTADERIDSEVFRGDLTGINGRLASSTDRLDATVAPYDFHSILYLIHPVQENANSQRLVIVHSGHRQGVRIGEGVNDAVNRLLQDGFHVLIADMPLVGWNSDASVRLPESKTDIQIDQRGTAGHNSLFQQLAPPVLPDGEVFRFFLEPIVQGVNHFLKTQPNAGDVSMLGLSGGGWTTHVSAAVDVRIRRSFPVAGAYPLYARRLARGSWGDAEQVYAPLYGESDANEDGITDTATGVASWLEIFALGGIGRDRQQIQILNFEDSCCFSTEAYKSYDHFLGQLVNHIGYGSWHVHSDRTHQSHIISTPVLNEVIIPAIGADQQ
ncbi:MAG: hypothetical protein KDA85_15435, partial [Planctomycetaceae bacterium]|nr:hypothetical protein [Planctomycetaceae bacterium]